MHISIDNNQSLILLMMIYQWFSNRKSLFYKNSKMLRGYKQYTYIKLYKNDRYLQYLLEYVPYSSGYNN